MRAYVITLGLVVACATTRPQTAVQLKPGATPVSRFAPGDYDVELRYANLDRYYVVHVPPQASARQPLPVVLAFHGGGGSPKNMPLMTGMNAVADEQGFVVVYPAGTGNPNLGRRMLTWNAGFCCGPAKDAHVDDSGFIVAVLRDLATRTPVDRTRVYATGISNGGFMSYRVGIDLSDRIAAIAPIAGALPDVPTGAEPVAVMHFHSKDDPRALYAGGLGPAFPYTDAHVQQTAVEPVIAAWARRNGCSPAQPDAVDHRTSHDGAHTATKLVYTACPAGAEVVFWQLSGAGHVWPGGPVLSVQKFLGPATDVVDADHEMWAFFAQHTKPNAPSLDDAPVLDATAVTSPAPAPAPTSRAVSMNDVLDESPLEVTFNRSFVGLRATSTPPSDAPDLGGNYASRSVAMNSSISLYSHAAMRRGRLSMVRVQAQASLAFATSDVPMLGTDRRLARGLLGATALYMAPSMNAYGVFVGGSFAQETDTLGSLHPHPLAAGFGTHRFGERVALLYGAAFTYVFGRPLALPLLGLSWHPTRAWNVTVLAPVVASATFALTKRVRLGASLGVTGEQYQIANGGMFPGQSDQLSMRVAAGKLGVSASYALTKDLRVGIDVGALGPRRLAFVDDRTTISESSIHSAGYLTATIDYAFGSLPY